ncbi:MAG TPA: MBG domain-containing protein [Gammaproteobacteria bacterium]|nr:MBG domain-containing protein [Gammaproteobacteria bacterium]
MSQIVIRPARLRVEQRPRRRIAVRRLTLTLGLAAQAAVADPSGGVVVGGRGSIGGSPGNQVITQQSLRLAIDWQSFSLAAGERTEFRQPDASAVALNRVIGGAPSEIHGRILANGQVYLVNPQGVLFGQGAQVDVGGLVASTLALSAQDFMAGSARFTDTGGEGRVVNEGSLRAAEGGYVALLGRQVTNAGRIEAPRGTVALAAGEQISLRLDDASLVELSVDRATLDALVENHGAIRADGGAVLLTAHARDALLDTVVNNDGVIEANSVGSVGGVVRLGGGEGGVVQVSGTLAARGDEAGEAGGAIEITGRRIALIDAAQVDASGEAGGGTVHVGGSRQGQGPLPNSEAVFIGRDARLDASAGAQGDGGEIVVYAEDSARVHGRLAATGGAAGGDGGFVETSGKRGFELTATPLVKAAAGAPGTWLIDPLNVVISANANQCVGLGGCVNGPNWTSTASGATLGANLITAALNAGQNVTIATGAGGSGAGDITLLGSPVIQKSAGAADVTLSLSAHNDIGITAPIAQTGGSAVGRLNVVLRADSDANGIGNVALRTPITTGGGSITATGQNVTVLGSLTTTGTAGRDGGAIDLGASPQGALNVTAASLTAAGGSSTGAGRSGGDIALSGGSVSARGLNADGGKAGGSHSVGGRAGTITLDSTRAMPLLVLNGNVSARGGDGTGSGAGGAGGALTTADPLILGGAVAIAAAGGAGGTPGAGGDVSLATVDSSSGARRAFTVEAGSGRLTSGALGDATPLAAVSLAAGGGVTTGNITTTGLPNAAGGAVTIDAGTSGAVTLGNVTTRGTTTTGAGSDGGAVSIAGNTIAAGAIDTSGATAASSGAGGAGGAVSLRTAGTNPRLTLTQDILTSGGGGLAGAGGASGAVRIDGPVRLAADVAITSRPGVGATPGAGGTIDFGPTATIDSDGAPRALVLNGAGPVSLQGAIGEAAPLASLAVSGGGAIALSAARVNGDLRLTTNGDITGSGALHIGGRTEVDAGAGAIALYHSANDFVGAVAARTSAGSVRLNDANALLLAGSSSGGAFTATANGDLRIAAGAGVTSTNGDVVLAARNGNFINDAGAGAISAPNGRWLVYATSPAGNVPNGLAPGNARPNFYGRTIDSAPPATIEDGNHFVYSFRPTLTVTALDAGKIFGDADPASFGYTSAGLLVGDALADVFDGGLTRAPGENVGAYAIGATPAPSPIGYAVTVLPASFTIASRAITISANAAGKVFGDVDPALGYTVSAGSLATIAEGALRGSLARAPGENVGSYGINRGTLANPNYAITFQPGHFDITPRPISIAADPAAKIFGDPDPALGYTLTAGSLATIPGGALEGALARSAGETVGSYAITQGTLGNPNYAIDFTPGSLSITPRAVTIAVTGDGKQYGDPDPVLGYTVTGGSLAAIPEGALTGRLARAPGEDVGAYAVTQGTLGNPNYALSFTPGSFDIVPRPLTVRAMDASRAVGVANPPFAASFENFAFGEDRSVLGGTLVYTTAAELASPAGRYAITPSGLTATNYRIVYVDGTLTVFDPNGVPTPQPPLAPSGEEGSAEAIIAARQNRPPLPTIAGLARLDIVDEGILLPAEARTP